MNNQLISNDIDENTGGALIENLTKLLDSHQINENELAKNLNIPYNTIHRIMNGSTGDPRISTLQQIADYFGVTVDSLLKENKTTKVSEKEQINVPVFGWDDISQSNFLEKINVNSWKSWIAIAQIDNLNTDSLFALESTRSMQPRFPLGTTFIVLYKEQPIDGDLVLIKFKDTNAVSLRELIIDHPNWRLDPVIHGSSPLIFNHDDCEVIGVVVLTLIHTRKT